MNVHNVAISEVALGVFCRKWKVRELSLFGSVLREDFRADSDVDVLVDYAPDARVDRWDQWSMREELSQLLGRRVDLVSRRAVERSADASRRQAMLESARPFHVQG